MRFTSKQFLELCLTFMRQTSQHKTSLHSKTMFRRIYPSWPKEFIHFSLREDDNFKNFLEARLKSNPRLNREQTKMNYCFPEKGKENSIPRHASHGRGGRWSITGYVSTSEITDRSKHLHPQQYRSETWCDIEKSERTSRLLRHGRRNLFIM